MKLTIAIPTYNRRAEILRTLSFLAENKQADDVEILILDNASTHDLKTDVAGVEYKAKWPIFVIRNNVNVGFSANYIRLFEHARGDWVWTLGDDDAPTDDAVEKILELISSASKNVAEIKFSLPQCCFIGDKEVGSIGAYSELFKINGFWHADIFISNSVMRREFVLSRLGSASHWGVTMVPQMVLRILLLRDGYFVKYSSQEIVVHVPVVGGTSWSLNRFSRGVMNLADIEGAEVFRKNAMPYIAKSFFGEKNWPKSAIAFGLKDAERKNYSSFYIRWALLANGFFRVYLLILSFIVPLLRKTPFVLKIVAAKYALRQDAGAVLRS